MKYILKTRLLSLLLVFGLGFCLLFGVVINRLNESTKITQASFKCPEGYSYFQGGTDNKSKPLPHNCTKADNMVMVCENDYIEDPVRICRRDLVVYKCPQPLNSNDFVINKSIINPQTSALKNTNVFAKLFQPLKASALFGPDPTTFLPDEYKNYGNLCTDIKYKDNFSVGNICNSKVFGDNPTSRVKSYNLSSNGIPLPDENGLVSYFNDLALKDSEKDYGKLKTDLYDVFNNDNSPYANQLCLAPAKALRANVNAGSSTPPCFLFGCGPTTFFINEIVADVADTCDLQARTCKSILQCIRSIHKCEPQDKTFPITDFNYFIGKEQKGKNGEELSTGRAIQFEPDYENLPEQRIFLPSTATTTICPNNIEWRPFFVAAKTDFKLYDTQFQGSRPVISSFLCVKKGFNLKAAYTLLRDASQDCGARTRIYADAASDEDSAMIICTPPLTSNIKVPVCPGGTSIKVLGDYTNIEGNKCYKSIPPEVYVVDTDVVNQANCSPNTIKPNTKLNCIFNLSKSSFAGYSNPLDLAKIISDPTYKLPTDNKFESCKVLPPLTDIASQDEIKKSNDEIYYNKITCAALTASVSNQKYTGHFELEGEVRAKINNSNNSTLATSDLCKIPSSTFDGKTQYENILVCENINIGDTFEEGSKNILIKIGDLNFNKGTIEAKLGGCTEGIADIYDCYRCLSGQVYNPGKPCFQPGESVATKDSPINIIKNKELPIIPIKNETLPINTPAKLTPEGCSKSIDGTIQVGGFVPNANQTIPDCAKIGDTTATIEANGIKITVPTNFTDDQIQTVGATSNIAVPAKIGDPAPVIDLPNNTLPNGTIATFTPNGSSISIKGIIKNNQFVPDPRQTIPVGSTLGLAVGVINTANSTTGVLVNIQSTPELIKNVPIVRTGGAARE